MLSRQFLSWAPSASAGERAEATQSLASVFLYADLHPTEQGDMERVLTSLLDDPSPLVRRALAEALAGAAHAPHHLIAALAVDGDDVASIVLERSSILDDAELVDAAAIGGPGAQSAVARRAGLSAAVAGALAEIGTRGAVLALCRNHGATLAGLSVHRILERFGEDGGIREALGARPDLDAPLRHAVVAATAEALRRFVTGRGWVGPERARRIVGEAGERAAIALAHQDGARDGEPARLRFAAYLRQAGQLTPALVMRVVISGESLLFEALLSELSGQPPNRVASLVRRHEGLGFAALLRSAGLPDALLPVIRAALDALRAQEGSASSGLRRETVARVLDRCGLDQGSTLEGLTALLRRFEAEAAREESRAVGRAPAVVPRERALPALGRADGPKARIEPRFAPLPTLAAA